MMKAALIVALTVTMPMQAEAQLGSSFIRGRDAAVDRLRRQRIEDYNRSLAEREMLLSTRNNLSAEQIANRNAVREIQKALNYFGFAAGAADGIFGPNTQRAILVFQYFMSYPTTGVLSQVEEATLLGAYLKGLASFPRQEDPTPDEAMQRRALLAPVLDEAQFNLGNMYRDGQGVPQDYAEAVRWYRLAAEQGDADAQFNLGVMYDQGQSVAQDYTEAMRWYRLAAEQGLAEAQVNLGVMYADGQGVLENYVTAHMWFNIAAANGHTDAPGNRDRVAAQMTPADISEAQRRAVACMASGYQSCD